MNQILLRQARDSINRVVEENPITFIVYEQPITTNSEGRKVEDPEGEPEEKVYRGRLFANLKGIESFIPSPAGEIFSNDPVLLISYKNRWLRENTIFEGSNNRYMVIKKIPLIKYSGDIGYICRLQEAMNADT